MAKQIASTTITVVKEGSTVTSIAVNYTVNDSVNTDLTKNAYYTIPVTPQILATTFSDGLSLLESEIKMAEGIS